MTTDEYRRFKNRSVNRWLGGLIAVLLCCNVLVLGPCDVGDYLYGKPAIEGLKYGDTADWDGPVPFPREADTCPWGHCFY